MGVIAEAISVVIRVATIEARLPGGLAEYERLCPNNTFCHDESICRVGFMRPSDAREYVNHLISLGFEGPQKQRSTELAVVDQASGFLMPCDWLQLDRREGVTIAWLKGTELAHFVAPPGWTPGPMTKVSLAEIEKEYEHVDTKDGVETYRHRKTGELKYVGRPRLPKGKNRDACGGDA